MNIKLIIYSLKDLNTVQQKINYKQLLNITTNFINITSINLIKTDVYTVKIQTEFNKFIIIIEEFETLIKYLNDIQIITGYILILK